VEQPVFPIVADDDSNQDWGINQRFLEPFQMHCHHSVVVAIVVAAAVAAARLVIAWLCQTRLSQNAIMI
jgi:hypothetical protein